MRWYVLQTLTGKEEKLVEMIGKLVPRELYDKCFVIYHEQLWRRQQQNLIHVARAFPGYVFITAEVPEELFLHLRRVPAMSKMISDGQLNFLFLDAAEADFLRRLMDENHVIRLSYLSTDGKGGVRRMAGPLEFCAGQEVRYRFRKRCAAVHLRLSGQEKDVLLGFVLDEDLRRELHYGKVEAPIRVPERYRIPMISTEQHLELVGSSGQAHMPETSLREYPTAATVDVGDSVIVNSGELAGTAGTVIKIKKSSVRLAVRFAQHELEIEVPWETVQRI